MQLTQLLRAKGFGELYKIHRLVTYKISPLEQRAFANAITRGIPNLFQRFRAKVFYVAGPFAVAYIIYDLGERRHAQLLRKNPADYADDV